MDSTFIPITLWISTKRYYTNRTDFYRHQQLRSDALFEGVHHSCSLKGNSDVARYVLRRVLLIPITLLGVLTIVFIALRLSGDPASLFVGQDATASEIEAVRERLGFNDSLIVQYTRFLKDAAQLEFGRSLRYGEPAFALLLKRWPATLELASFSLLIALLIGIPLGTISALKRGTLLDTLSSIFSLIGQGAPVFWIAMMLILVFSINFKLFPASGRGTWRHLILPSVSLGAFFAARVARITRTALLDTISQPYVQTARAKGLTETQILIIHISRNAAIPVVTILGLSIPSLIGGAVMTEAIFAWPGIAGFIVNAVYNRDYPVVQAGVFVIAVMVAVINLAVDVLYTYIDPRIQYRSER